MKKKLDYKDVVYEIEGEFLPSGKPIESMPEYFEVYRKIEDCLSINKEGYNLYLIDSFSKDQLKNISEFIDKKLSNKERPKDICFVVYDDEKAPIALFLNNGNGIKLTTSIEKIKFAYIEAVCEFNGNSSNQEREDIIGDIQKIRTEEIENLIDSAKKEGFELKATSAGFSFIPLKDGGEPMTEEEYDLLEKENKHEILEKASKLKAGAEYVLEKLKALEESSTEKLKVIFKDFLDEKLKDIKDDIITSFIDDKNAKEYIEYITSNIEYELIDAYSVNYEEDEEKFVEIINKYKVNLVVDNKENKHPKVIFEEDPTINNLIGNIEYENQNGVYYTDISLITAGSVLKANEGCLIIRVSSLLNNQGAYYYLKRILLNGKAYFDFNRGYLELLSLNGLKLKPVPIDLKVILIGDYESYNVLYSYDEDFKKLFPIRAEYNPEMELSSDVVNSIYNYMKTVQKEGNLLEVDYSAVKEVVKFLSREAESRNKVLVDHYLISKLVTLANNEAKRKMKNVIDGEEIIEIAYHEEYVEREYMKMYENNKILTSKKKSMIGSINGLSVVDTGYARFGKPLRITALCTKGDGRIIDIQKESNLSGNIHEKAMSTLRGLISSFFDPYSKLPVDFHLSFEQIYGIVEGDSASVAEFVCILSALSKIPINQDLAVTGSLNLFGEVQPIGGVNEKIEGFYKVCKSLGGIKGKGVIIPESNKDELVLSKEVEESIKSGEFSIYTITEINDAILLLMGEECDVLEDILMKIKEEAKKYSKKS